jgi:hypothetical protein
MPTALRSSIDLAAEAKIVGQGYYQGSLEITVPDAGINFYTIYYNYRH